MYTGHFGLDDGPFHGKAEGEDVYIGPQQAAVICRLRKALGTGGPAVAVSGPVGVGKTTLVRRAIADIPGRKVVIPVDRIRLEHDEVLDLLLACLDVSRQPKGTIQRVAAFRRLLQERLADDARVFIVVEDAERVGTDALLELEALTASDGGEPVGANIVLMGDSDLPALLSRPALARLRQRIRLRQAVVPFDAGEVEGYMRHCLEMAGGVLEQIFEPGTTRIVHRYSGGIARVVDNLCESALVAAAEAGLATILPEFLQEVAGHCGLEPQAPDTGVVAGERTESSPPAVGEIVDEAPAGEPPAEDQEPAVTAVAPPKLALVEKRSEPGEERRADDASPPEDEQDAETRVHNSSSPVDAVADERSEAAPAPPSPEEERNVRGASLVISRIDEVLPEPVEGLKPSVRGQGGPASALPPPAVPRSHDNDLPTLSNSMRIALLPVRRMDERPLTAEHVDDDEVSEHVSAPVVGDQPAPEPEALDADGSGQASDEDTGTAEALPEAGIEPQVEPVAESPGLVADRVIDEPESVAASVDAASDEPEPVAATAELPAVEACSPQAYAEAAVPDGIEPPNAEDAECVPIDGAPPEIVLPPETAGLQERTQEQSPEQQDEQPVDAAGEQQPAAGPLSVEPAPACGESSSLGTVVAEESEEPEHTEAPTPSVEEELTLAADAATDVFVADSDAGDGEEPELDALQAAIQAANAWQASDATGVVGEQAAAAPAGKARGALPEITLDAELEKRKPSPTEQLDQWAEELSKAKSLEDISDILAETIFGNEEIEAISAEIRAKKAAEKATAQPPAPPPKAAPARPPVAPSRPKPSLANAAPARPVAASRPASRARPAASGAMNMTLSQRIEMVNSLKGKKALKPLAGMPIAEIVLAEQPDAPPSKAAANAPAPIEAQIDTAITQARQVLSKADLARMASRSDDDDDGDADGDKKGSRGLFGLFRRSSKS